MLPKLIHFENFSALEKWVEVTKLSSLDSAYLKKAVRTYKMYRKYLLLSSLAYLIREVGTIIYNINCRISLPKSLN